MHTRALRSLALVGILLGTEEGTSGFQFDGPEKKSGVKASCTTTSGIRAIRPCPVSSRSLRRLAAALGDANTCE
jgi:hypothetical protein